MYRLGALQTDSWSLGWWDSWFNGWGIVGDYNSLPNSGRFFLLFLRYALAKEVAFGQ